MLKLTLCAFLLLCGVLNSRALPGGDPYLWLEDVDGEPSLEWVRTQNARSTAILEQVPEFVELRARNLEIYTSSEKMPSASFRGDYCYNFWRDGEHVRGLLRRCALKEYEKEHPGWEPVLDVDALAEAEGENWVYKDMEWLQPDCRYAMVQLSRGGSDAVVIREFDAVKKEFVEGGFELPEAKSDVSWKDRDTLYVGTDWGAGSLTDSGYPRFAREWKRGTPYTEAKPIYEVPTDFVGLSAYAKYTPERTYHLVQTVPEFYRGEHFLIERDGLRKLELPIDVGLEGFFAGRILLALRSDWPVGGETYPAGALIAIDLDDFLAGGRDFETLFAPTERTSFSGSSWTKGRLLVSTLDNVKSRLWSYRVDRKGNWKKEEILMPGIGTGRLAGTSVKQDRFFLMYTDFLTPSSIYLVEKGGAPRKLKSTPEWFDASGMKVTQEEAISKDGTRIPYFLVWPKGATKNGKNPTLLSGYGGFENSSLPYYSATTGHSWLARGGFYALANIRGGGEFGPKWHQVAVREGQQKTFDDFIAVGEDLIAKGITSPAHLGIEGGSQGGLLVGTAFTQRPDLFGAVVCAVPLLDMKRYHKLLAGASWMAEYGDPDNPDDWEFIRLWSPYQLIQPGVKYPEPFFFTSTRDDRVHPGHARKMVAKMLAYGHPVLYWENTEGGHAGSANLEQAAYQWALAYSYLWRRLR